MCENPLPAMFGAVAVGFAIGLIARSLEKEREPEPIRDALRGVLASARDLRVEPARRWWKQLWT